MYAYICYYTIRKEVNTMSKRKKRRGGKPQPDTLINLAASVINLIIAILLLIDKLSE